MKLSNWGNYPIVDVNLKNFSTLEELNSFLSKNNEMISRGLGRCYGDSSLSKNVLSILRFNRILAFNPSTGEATCEAGISLKEILDTFVPKSWFLPVVPGTKFVTLGGAIASDIHGKNHHLEGSMSRYITSLEVLLSDGSTIECSSTVNNDLFWSTCGGMGLTGIILRATIKLKPIETAYIKQKETRCKNLEEIMIAFEKSYHIPYSVAWIDCLAQGNNLGRSILITGEHAKLVDLPSNLKPLISPTKRTLNIAFDLPNNFLNNTTVKMFNFFYYHRASVNSKEKIVDYDTFFFPLDKIHSWNKIYGKRGFTQYQFVIPKISSKAGIGEVLTKVSQTGQPSFLAVLKLFGKQDNLISFPKEGYTLSLDFSITNKLFPFLDELDKIVIKYGGRIYLAKDVRMNKETFYSGYPNIEKFKLIKHKYDKQNKFQSLQSKRIGI